MVKESTCQCRRCGFDLRVGKIPWRRKWQPTPAFRPGEPHGQRSLAGCSPWGRRVITTEHAHTEHKDVKGLPFFPVPHPALGTNKTRKHVYKLTFSEVLTLAKVWDEKWKMKVKSLSRVRLFATPWTVAYQAPPSMGFSRQECWSGLPFPSPGDLPNPGIEPGSPILQADALPSEPQSLRWVWFQRAALLSQRGPRTNAGQHPLPRAASLNLPFSSLPFIPAL